VEKAQQYAYRDRRNKKRDFRSLWIQRINAASRIEGVPYSIFMRGLHLLSIDVDRKILADMAVRVPLEFSVLVKKVKDFMKKSKEGTWRELPQGI
jgi:large subunit ribosomal protein L20